MNKTSGNKIKPSLNSKKTVTKNRNIQVTEFAKKPWIVIITLVIALLAGIPGVISLFNQNPKITFIFKVTNSGYSNLKNGNITGVIIVAVKIVNTGGKPLLLNSPIEGYVKYNDNEIQLEPTLLPDSIKSNPLNSVNNLNIKNSNQKDLQRLTKLASDESVDGFLEFYINPVLVNEFEKSSKRAIKIVCHDVSGHKYESDYSEIQGRIVSKPGGKLFYPGWDMTIEK